MARHTRILSEALTGYLTTADGTAEVRARLIYEARDPYAVIVTIKDQAGVVQVWAVGRDLLLSCLTATASDPAGMDLIRLWTCPSRAGRSLLIAMMASFFSVLELNVPDVSNFLDRTWDLVPSGGEPEHFDLDAELYRLLV